MLKWLQTAARQWWTSQYYERKPRLQKRKRRLRSTGIRERHDVRKWPRRWFEDEAVPPNMRRCTVHVLLWAHAGAEEKLVQCHASESMREVGLFIVQRSPDHSLARV